MAIHIVIAVFYASIGRKFRVDICIVCVILNAFNLLYHGSFLLKIKRAKIKKLYKILSAPFE